MFQSIFPILPALIVAHAWMTLMIVHTLGDDETFAMPPETFPV